MGGAHREYTAIFAIGAKLLGSFKGVMAQAEARMAQLRNSAVKMGKGLLAFAGSFGGVLSLVAGLALGKLLHSIFSDAQELAAAAEQRTRALGAALMLNNKVAKGGTKEAERQVALIYEHNKALQEQGVLHKDILDTMAVQLAMKGGIPPKQISESLDVMQNMLTATKGVAANEEDGAAMATAWAAAVAKGRLLGLSKQGVTINKEWAKTFAKLKSPQERFNALMKQLGPAYKGFNEQLRATPSGRIQLLHNAMKDLSLEIGEDLLPVWADLADVARTALPVIKPVVIGSIKAVGRAAEWAGRQVTDFFKVLNPPAEAKPQVELFTKYKQALGSFNAVTGRKDDSFNATTDAMNQWTRSGASELLASLGRVKDAFEGLGIALDDNKVHAQTWGEYFAQQVDYVLQQASLKLDSDAQDIKKITAIYKNTDWKAVFKDWIDALNDIQKLWQWITANMTNEKLVKTWEDNWQRMGLAVLGLLWPLDEVKKALEAFDVVSPIQDIKTGWQNLWKQPTSKPPASAASNAIGGIIRRPMLSMLGERGPEAVIPLRGGARAEGLLSYANQALGSGRGSGGTTTVNFAPQVTINGNASETEQRALDNRLRSLAKDFINQFKAAQQQERRLSYESGYA